jgi:hypothetical protein
MENLMHRLKQFIDLKGINISSFEKAIGMSNASFGKSLKNGGTIGADKLENVLKKYHDLNPIWLLTGEGDILLNEYQEFDNKTRATNELLLKERLEMIEMQKTMIKMQKQIIDRLKQQVKDLGGEPIE